MITKFQAVFSNTCAQLEKTLITLMQPSAAQLVAVAPAGRDLLRSRFGAAGKVTP